MAAMTFDQQQDFARFLRSRLPYDWRDKHLPLSVLTDHCARVLGKRVGHWRDLSVEEARQVMAATKT